MQNPYITIIRIENCLMASLATLVGILVTYGYSESILLPTIIAMFSVFLITAGGNVVNDLYDIDSDRINRPNRPLPRNAISTKVAVYYSFLFFFCGIVVASILNPYILVLAVFNSLMLWIYSKSLQDKFIIGNIVVAYLVSSTFIYGGLLFGPNISYVIVLSLLAFLSTLSREIVKDMEDIAGDKVKFLKSIVRGVKKKILEKFKKKGNRIESLYEAYTMSAISSLLILITIVLSFIPFHLNMFGYSYLFSIIIADIIFLFSSFKVLRCSRNIKCYRSVQKMMKIAMFIALISFILGRFL